MSDKKLIFYDLKNAQSQCWSPNLWKVRLALRYKQIPFETVWLTYPDIKPTIGAHCQQDRDAPELPTIQHGDVWVHESFAILQYLESAFPSTPPLLLPSLPATHLFNTYYTSVLFEATRHMLLPLIPAILDARGAEYFARTRRERLGMSLEEYAVGAGVGDWRAALGVVVQQLEWAGAGKWVMGDQLSYADILVCALLLWMYKLDPQILEQTFAMYDGAGGEALRAWYGRMVPLAKADL